MRDDLIVQKVKEGIEKRGKLPAAERIADMIERGVIDKNGKVLLRMPSAPKKACASMTNRSAKDGAMSAKPTQGKKKG